MSKEVPLSPSRPAARLAALSPDAIELHSTIYEALMYNGAIASIISLVVLVPTLGALVTGNVDSPSTAHDYIAAAAVWSGIFTLGLGLLERGVNGIRNCAAELRRRNIAFTQNYGLVNLKVQCSSDGNPVSWPIFISASHKNNSQED